MQMNRFHPSFFFILSSFILVLSLQVQADSPARRGIYVVDPATGQVSGLYTPEESGTALQKIIGRSDTPSESEIPQFREITSRQRYKYVSIDEADQNNTSFGLAKAGGSVDKRFDGFWFLDNPTENGGFLFIPPDPIATAGKSRLIAVVNTMIESRNFGGKLMWRTSLQNFFSPLGNQTLNTFTFDPKIVYDQYEDRFVVVTLEQTEAFFGDDADGSRILLAVSKNGNPQTATAADWNYFAIDATVFIYYSFFGKEVGHWADYPGFEVDEDVIYVTANIFSYVTQGPDGNFYRAYGGSRLWIVPKTGFYDGSGANFSVHDPYGSTGLSDFGTTTMPAQVFGEGGVGGPGSTLGTYLVSYSGLTFGGPNQPEATLVISVDDPTGANGGPQFGAEFVILDDIENVGGIFGFPALPDAPQFGTDARIEVNDRRTLDAVYRDGALWMVTTIISNSGADAGQTSAHWIKMDASGGPGTIILADEGTIGGEDIAPGTFTFFPSVAVNRLGEAAFGFAASAPSTYAGAYVTGRQPGNDPGSVQSSATVRAGEDYYIRTFGAGRNRWGDYSGIAVDPSNDKFFWVFNEYATSRGTPTGGGEDGRWATAYARYKFTGKGMKKDLAFDADGLPNTLALEQNYPNPFNPETEILFQVPEQNRVVITIYNTLGQAIRTLTDAVYEAGTHSVRWDALDRNGYQLASGIYFYQMRAGDFTQIRKMTLLR